MDYNRILGCKQKEVIDVGRLSNLTAFSYQGLYIVAALALKIFISDS